MFFNLFLIYIKKIKNIILKNGIGLVYNLYNLYARIFNKKASHIRLFHARAHMRGCEFESREGRGWKI